MSAAPLPMSSPSTTFAAKGGDVHSSSGPEGTMSVWPKKQNTFPESPNFANNVSQFSSGTLSIANPSGISCASIRSKQPSSLGETDLIFISD